MSHPSDTSGPEKKDAAAISEKESSDGGVIILFFIFGLVASMVVGWVVFPTLLYSKKRQPVDFNHKLHVAEVEKSCESCHFYREDGSFSGIPKLDNCRQCHETTIGVSDEEAQFVAEYINKNKEVPWLVYSRQPDCVFFSHAAHTISGNMACATCHGDIGESTQSPIYEVNRITGYSRNIWGKNIAGFKKNTWDRMKMDDCSECHMKNDVKQNSEQTKKGACFVCHK